VVTIDDLPDDVLLEIFDFYVVRYQDLGFRQLNELGTKEKVESWQSLVHVSRRWRCLVFGSARRLNLQIYYHTPRVTARKSPDVWPALPLLIQSSVDLLSVDDVIAVLEHRDRICQFNLGFHTSWQIGELWTAMQVPFPELTCLYLSIRDLSYGPSPVFSDSFLGGSALSPFLSGIETRWGTSHRTSMIDSCPSAVLLTVPVIFFSFVLVLWIGDYWRLLLQ
jgi:hypothetical protein